MKKKSMQLSVLIPEAESNFLSFIVNCLFEKKGVDIYIISNREDVNIKRSRKIKNYSYYPKGLDELELISSINNELKKFKIDVIMPIDEFGIEALIKNKDKILHKDKLFFLPTLEAFYNANDKGLLAKHLLKNELPTPKSFLIKSGDSFQNDSDVKFPVLAKPTIGSGGGDGIKKFFSNEELKSFFNNNNNNNNNNNKFKYDYLIEEYIDGFDLGCNVLCKNGKLLAYTMQKGTLWSDKPFSPQIGLEFFYNQQLYDIIEKLMKSLMWNGVANIDIRFDNKTKQFLVLEINPRFWETTEASEIAGVNFPYLYCLSAINVDFEVLNYKHTKFLTLTGIKPKIKQNFLFIFNFSFLLKNTPLKYYKKNPLSILSIIYSKFKGVLNI
ncbi:ATP-grasp domain-containing protein [Thalassobellus citreus]|uniref:ATP-grasp domain-containing protein n=1 Tax=Thalassobellus citreus TaxID=3367752 RepID=UPI0037A4EA55